MDHVETVNPPPAEAASDEQQSESQLLALIKRLALTFAGVTFIFLAFIFALLWFSAGLVDQFRVEQSMALVQSDLKRNRGDLAARAKDLSWWDDVIENAVVEQHSVWLEDNFQQYLYSHFNITELLVLGDKGEALYADREGERVSPDQFLGFDFSQLQRLVNRAQKAPMNEPVAVTGAIARQGEFYWVAVCAITSDKTSGILAEGTPRPTLILVRSIASILPDIERSSGLVELHSSMDAAFAEGEAASIVMPIMSAGQQPVGYLHWSILLPGQQLLHQVSLLSAPVLLLCLIAAWFIARWFRVALTNVEELIVKNALIRDSQQYFQAMADDAPVLIWEVDREARVTYTNRHFLQLLGKQASQALPLNVLNLVSVDDRQIFAEFFQTVVNREQPQDHEFRFTDIEGGEHWLSVVCAPHYYAFSDHYGYIFSASDITERKAMEESVWQQAHYDNLTGLPNRNLFQDRLKKELEAAARRGTEFALMFIDLDNFKNINDSLGHGVGDQVLIQAAKRIVSCLRESDTVARLGGDEFVLLVPTYEGHPVFERVAQRVLSRLSECFYPDNNEVYLSASIGLAKYPRDGEDSDTLMMNADTAMYRAKQAGRNQISYYTSEMNAELKAVLQMEVDLHQALEQEEFFLQYQPIIDLATQRIVSVEALVRWRREDGSIVPPDQFIPIVERTGLIKPLGNTILKNACRQLSRWRQQGFDLSMSINVSPVQFSSNKLLSDIQGVLDSFSLPPGSVQLELTESLLIEEREDIVLTLDTLANMGVRLAVDDFGTGYSALSYLRKFAVHTLKIDRAFIRDIPSSEEDMALVRAIIVMAHSLHLTVIAEGVETTQQNDFLVANGCNRGQGYLYGRPSDIKGVTALLRADYLLGEQNKAAPAAPVDNVSKLNR